MVSAGDPTRVYLDSAVRHVMLRQGVLGIKVRAALTPASCSFFRSEPISEQPWQI
jgi:ribosomal protein S3